MIFVLETITMRFKINVASNFNLREAQIALGVMAAILFFMTFELLIGFSRINEFFEAHTLKLFTLRQTLSDLLKFSDFYFKDASVEADQQPTRFNQNGPWETT